MIVVIEVYKDQATHFLILSPSSFCELCTPCTVISPCHARRWMPLHTPCTWISPCHARRWMSLHTPCTWLSACYAHISIPFHSRWLSLHSCQDISFLGSSAPSSQTYQRRAFQTGPPLPPQARTRRNRFRWVLLTATLHRHGVCFKCNIHMWAKFPLHPPPPNVVIFPVCSAAKTAFSSFQFNSNPSHFPLHSMDGT